VKDMLKSPEQSLSNYKDGTPIYTLLYSGLIKRGFTVADIKKFDRMFEILCMIDRGERCTAERLAAEFGVAERTIFRDMEFLSRYYPLYFDVDAGAYRFTEGYSLNKADLAPDEIKAMLMGRTVAAKMGEKMSGAFDHLMEKLNVEMGYRTRQRLKGVSNSYWVDLDPVHDFSKIRKQHDAIERAMDEKISIEVTYERIQDREKTVRLYEPYGLFLSEGVWYAIGYCHLREDVRILALDCIRKIRSAGKSYSIPDDFSMDDYFKSGWHIIRYGEPVEIVLRFSEEVAPWIRRKKWHPSQKIGENGDGSIEFSVTLDGTDEIKRWIYHWGPNCEVISPPEFRQEVAEELNQMTDLYKKG